MTFLEFLFYQEMNNSLTFSQTRTKKYNYSGMGKHNIAYNTNLRVKHLIN